MRYYDKLLKGEVVTEIEKEYQLDILHSSFAGISLRISGKKGQAALPRTKTLESFVGEIASLIGMRKIYFVDYQNGILTVKRELRDCFEIQKYYFTEKAQKNRKLLRAIDYLKEEVYDYDEAMYEDVNASLLANLLYGDGKIFIVDEIELKRFKSYCEEKNYYVKLAQKKKLMKKYGFLIHVPIRIGLIALSFIPGTFLLNWGCGLFCSAVSQLLYQNGLEIYFTCRAERETEKFIQEALQESEEAIYLLKNQQEKEQLDKEKDDAFVADIRKAIDKVNAHKYAGYREHLKFLYKLTLYYLKTKNVNSARQVGELFLEDGSLMKALLTIEGEIEAAIQRQKKEKNGEEILAEVGKRTGLPSEMLEEVEESVAIDRVQSEEKVELSTEVSDNDLLGSGFTLRL